jgi:tetratricopeptide (TPR) repeat protein
LIGLGHVHLALDLHSDGAGYYQQSLDLARELHSKNWQFEAFQGLGRIHLAAGRPALSLDHHGQALEFATQLAQVPDQARAHDGLAHAYHALHQYDHARLHWRYALDLLTALGIDRTEEAQTSVTNIRAHLSRQPPA